MSDNGASSHDDSAQGKKLKTENDKTAERLRDAVAAHDPTASPWASSADGSRHYVPDIKFLDQLLGIAAPNAGQQESGLFASAIDLWCAEELRRSGFEWDEVWPRREPPMVLPRDLRHFIEGVPKGLAAQLRERISRPLRPPRPAPPHWSTPIPQEAVILGRVFTKQADVLIARWDRGAEVLISTKSMLSSYSNNLRNRFEESYGDAKNVKGRFPLVAMGFVYVMRSNILDKSEAGQWELAVDMLRKLREEPDVYDATALVIADWDTAEMKPLTVVEDPVPPDLRLGPMMERIISCVLMRTPVQMHIAVRERRDEVDLTGVEMLDETTTDDTDEEPSDG